MSLSFFFLVFFLMLLLTAAIIGGYGVVIYNSIVMLKNNIDKTWSNIDVLLKQRYDEIPKLVGVCEGYMKHERETLEAVIKARSMTGGAVTDLEKINAQNAITSALKSLFAVVENYPDLKANESFRRLGARITELEDQIADRREIYNESVNLYNIRIEQFPDILLARLMNFTRKTLWEINPAHREDVAVSFSGSR